MKTLWEKFVEYSKEQGTDDLTIRAYITKEPDVFDNLQEFLYHLASFLENEWDKRGLEANVYFTTEVDYSDYKYNNIVAKKDFHIEGESFLIEINSFLCKWGTVAESEKEFNEELEKFLKETKRRLDLLNKYLKEDSSYLNPANRYH